MFGNSVHVNATLWLRRRDIEWELGGERGEKCQEKCAATRLPLCSEQQYNYRRRSEAAGPCGETLKKMA